MESRLSGDQRRLLQMPIQNFLRICESNKGQMYILMERMRRAGHEINQQRALEINQQRALEINQQRALESGQEGALQCGQRSGNDQATLEASARGMVFTPFSMTVFSGEVKRTTNQQSGAGAGAGLSVEAELLQAYREFIQLFRPVGQALSGLRRVYGALGREPRQLLLLQVRLQDLASAQRPLEALQTCERALTGLEDLLTEEDLLSLLCEI
ncbi:hypothetical protein NL108_016647 [Boleophthalmus pectinirostris]|nr:hypothetical protein NL108_016647 [Boleophthalmus pectinirostris]